MRPTARFPDFILKLPEADISAPGLRGWLVQGPTSGVIFFEASAETRLPEHTHAAEWGIVLDGTLHIRMAGEDRVFRGREEFVIPANVAHAVSVDRGFRAVAFFADPKRYRPKPRR